ncbi:MAG: glucose-1-phosphate adenylyltransferase [Pirellulaceae bacterium]|nr:glucose-1-phosphate adenylyltransferase [Planctomycetales bacterium]
MRDVIALVLGGGRGTRLFPLTGYRSKPAVPLGTKYRLIDIPLSNCINSGINRAYVLTQFMSVSLHRHVRQTYRFDQFNGGFVELLAAQETMDAGSDWYEGTADAVRKNLKYLEQPWIKYVLILSGDQLYRMDYNSMMKTHLDTQAEVTIAGLPCTREQAKAFGIMRFDDTGRIEGFLEKPQTDEEMDLVKTDPAWIDSRGIPSQGRDLVASMGIYLFNRDFLVEVLRKTSYRDFGKEVFPAAFRTRRVMLHLFDDYWEDIGTIRAFYEANLSLCRQDSPFPLVSPEAPVYTRARFLPPAAIDGATISTSLIGDGCRIGRGSVIENSVIGLRCVIGENVTIRNSVIMGADMYESSAELAADATAGRTPIGIGSGTVIEGSIVDKNVRIGHNVRVANESNQQEADLDEGRCYIRDGIPIVVKDATLRDGWKMG